MNKIFQRNKNHGEKPWFFNINVIRTGQSPEALLDTGRDLVDWWLVDQLIGRGGI